MVMIMVMILLVRPNQRSALLPAGSSSSFAMILALASKAWLWDLGGIRLYCGLAACTLTFFPFLWRSRARFGAHSDPFIEL